MDLDDPPMPGQITQAALIGTVDTPGGMATADTCRRAASGLGDHGNALGIGQDLNDTQTCRDEGQQALAHDGSPEQRCWRSCVGQLSLKLEAARKVRENVLSGWGQ
jgi:hypothetical protein